MLIVVLVLAVFAFGASIGMFVNWASVEPQGRMHTALRDRMMGVYVVCMIVSGLVVGCTFENILS